MRLQVSDIGSNYEENLQRWAQNLGTSEKRRQIFLVIYGTRKASWSTREIAEKTNLSIKIIATEGKKMCAGGLLEQLDGARAIYQKIPQVQNAKKRILKLSGNVIARESLRTKRSSSQLQGTINMSKVTNRFQNVGVANLGTMSGSISGQSQRSKMNASTRECLHALENFNLELQQHKEVSTDQRADASHAVDELRVEVQKPLQSRNMSRVRNAVGALKLLGSGAQAVHGLYEQIAPLIASHFHLG